MAGMQGSNALFRWWIQMVGKVCEPSIRWLAHDQCLFAWLLSPPYLRCNTQNHTKSA
jgi:hypothetical protein